MTPWYRKVYTGAKLQTIWQFAIGISLVLTVVVIPTTREYLDAYKTKRWVGGSNQKEQQVDINKIVYEKLKRIRDKLDESKKES
jgi:hypothetical protein